MSILIILVSVLFAQSDSLTPHCAKTKCKCNCSVYLYKCLLFANLPDYDTSILSLYLLSLWNAKINNLLL